jgi:hypothetical protein
MARDLLETLRLMQAIDERICPAVTSGAAPSNPHELQFDPGKRRRVTLRHV